MFTGIKSHRDDLHSSRRFQPLVQKEQVGLRHTSKSDNIRYVPTVETVGYYANRPDGTKHQ